MLTMKIKCPKCETEVPTDVTISVHKSDRKPETGSGIYLDIGVDSVDYEPMQAHYAENHAEH